MPNPTNQTPHDRFIEAARETGCSNDKGEIRENMKQIAAVKAERLVARSTKV